MNSVSPAFTLLGSKAVIDASWCSRLFLDRRKDPLGVAPRVALPNVRRCSVGRLVHWKLLMNSYGFADTRTQLRISAAGGRELVRCELPDGQTVLLNMSALIGWSSSVLLGAKLSLQCGALALGTLFYVMARGPGVLLFETHGTPEVFDVSVESSPSLDFSRMVAWEPQTVFTIQGSASPLDIFFTQVHLRPSGSGTILVDSDAPIAGGGGLIKRFFTKFYVPK